MSKPLDHQVMTRTRELIEVETRWTQGFQATFRNGRRVNPHDPRAKRFCATGAMIRAGFELTGDIVKAETLRDAACVRLFPRNDAPVRAIEAINDARHGHAAILKLLDEYLMHEQKA